MFGFNNYGLQMKYNMGMKRLENEKISAFKAGSDKCLKCGLCCYKRPCALQKSDVPRIANFLNISEKELFHKYLVVDRFGFDYYLLPRRYEQEDIAGKFVPSERTFDVDTPCVFFDIESNLCKIHEVKPYQAVHTFCNEDQTNKGCDSNYDADKIEFSKEELINLGWDGEEY